MSDFDPYLKWLGIRKDDRPINHYRLLGLELFENDPDLISMAADRQMTHIRTYQSGPHGDASEKILNELARARRCLLMAEKKAAYDAELKSAVSQPVPTPIPKSFGELNLPVAKTITSSSIGIRLDPAAQAKTKKRERKQFLWIIGGLISGGLAAIGVSLAIIGSGVLDSSQPDQDGGEVSKADDKEPKPQPTESRDPSADIAGMETNVDHPQPQKPPKDLDLAGSPPEDPPNKDLAKVDPADRPSESAPKRKPEMSQTTGLPKKELAKTVVPEKPQPEIEDDGIDPFAVDPANPKPETKTSEPGQRARSAARKKIPESIRKTINEANDVPTRIVAAENLIAAADLQTETVMSYVVLKEAEALGISAGDARTAVEALRGINDLYEIDFWKQVQKTIDNASRYSSKATSSDFKSTIDELIEQAQEQARFDAAGKLLSAAIKLAKRARDSELASQYTRLAKRVNAFEKLSDSSARALVVLKSNPDDVKANLDQGNFLFAMKDDLDGALAHWAKCNNEKLVSLANLEPQNDGSNGSQIAELADAWWNVGRSNRTLQDHKSLLRSLTLYTQAAGLLSGLEKQAVEQKKDKLLKMTVD